MASYVTFPDQTDPLFDQIKFGQTYLLYIINENSLNLQKKINVLFISIDT